MRIAITGATGLLGRNLLFEILKQHLNDLDRLEIFVLGRPQKTASIDERVEDIIAADGCDYIGLPQNRKDDFIQESRRCISPIPFDLTLEDLGIEQDGFKILKAKKIDYFFHVAALTDFRLDNSVKLKLEEVNVKGTQRILELIKMLDIGQFIFVGSAYSCGSKTGLVEPDYVNIKETFRNPYEKSKLEAEILVREFAKNEKKNFKIFRPTTICGRLIEQPIGSTNKFDVFYGWAAFFLREKLKHLESPQKLFEEHLEFEIRIKVNLNSGLNIVPVDYAAKMLYGAGVNDGLSISCHIANQEDCFHRDYIKWIFENINVCGYSFVNEEPKDKNGLEKIYYKTVGKIFTPYIIHNPTFFKNGDLSGVEYKMGINCPSVDRDNFKKLMDFAKQNNFGIKT